MIDSEFFLLMMRDLMRIHINKNFFQATYMLSCVFLIDYMKTKYCYVEKNIYCNQRCVAHGVRRCAPLPTFRKFSIFSSQNRMLY